MLKCKKEDYKILQKKNPRAEDFKWAEKSRIIQVNCDPAKNIFYLKSSRQISYNDTFGGKIIFFKQIEY